MVDGRGPIYIDLRGCDESYWTDIAALSAGRGGKPRTNAPQAQSRAKTGKAPVFRFARGKKP